MMFLVAHSIIFVFVLRRNPSDYPTLSFKNHIKGKTLITNMMFSKLSIFAIATLAALATAASVPPIGLNGINDSKSGGDSSKTNVDLNNGNSNNGNSNNGNSKEAKCTTGPVECCLEKHVATAADVDLVHKKLGDGVNIAVGADTVWSQCSALTSELGKTCAVHSVCCDHIAADGSIAVGCKDTTA